MKHLLLIALITGVASLPTWSQNTAPTNQKQTPSQRILTADDFLKNEIDRGSGQEEITLLIRINEKSSPYSFHLIPDLKAHDQGEGRHHRGESRHHIGRIEVSKASSHEILQRIEVLSFSDASLLTQFFTAKDINFDGYLDIAVIDDHGAKWGSLNYWLFDKRTGRFIVNSLTNELRGLRFNEMRLYPKAREIHVSNLIAGCADDKRVYRVVRGHLILIQAEERERKEGGCTVTTRKRIHGRMKVIKIKKEPRRDN